MSTQYSGTSINELFALADNALAIHGVRAQVSEEVAPQFLDNAEAVLRGYLAPEAFLVNAMAHLVDPLPGTKYPHVIDQSRGELDLSDLNAYRKIQGVHDCLLTGLTDACFRCGQMRGFHGHFTELCPGAQSVFDGYSLMEKLQDEW